MITHFQVLSLISGLGISETRAAFADYLLGASVVTDPSAASYHFLACILPSYVQESPFYSQIVISTFGPLAILLLILAVLLVAERVLHHRKRDRLMLRTSKRVKTIIFKLVRGIVFLNCAPIAAPTVPVSLSVL